MNKRVKLVLVVALVTVAIGSSVYLFVLSKNNASYATTTIQYFSNGFENELATNFIPYTANGVTPTLSAEYARTGKYSADFAIPASDATARSQVVKEILPFGPRLYAVAYVYMSQGIESMTVNDRLYLIRLTDVKGSLVCSVGIRANGTNPLAWHMTYMRTDGDAVEWGWAYGSQISSIPKWTKLELLWSSAENLIVVRVDGKVEMAVSKTSDPALNLSDVSIASIQFGIYKPGVSDPPSKKNDPTGVYAAEVYMDDIGYYVPTNPITQNYVPPSMPGTGE